MLPILVFVIGLIISIIWSVSKLSRGCSVFVTWALMYTIGLFGITENYYHGVGSEKECIETYQDIKRSINSDTINFEQAVMISKKVDYINGKIEYAKDSIADLSFGPKCSDINHSTNMNLFTLITTI